MKIKPYHNIADSVMCAGSAGIARALGEIENARTTHGAQVVGDINSAYTAKVRNGWDDEPYGISAASLEQIAFDLVATTKLNKT
jgi:hypothetical protein